MSAGMQAFLSHREHGRPYRVWLPGRPPSNFAAKKMGASGAVPMS